MRINEWVSKVHNTAKSKGWWEKPREELELCQLFVTEIAEASECARNGEPAVHFGVAADTDFGMEIETHNGKRYWMENADSEKPYKPEGEAIELVDLLIRLGDYIGFRGWNLGESIPMLVDSPVLKKPADEITFHDVIEEARQMICPDSFSERPLVNHFQLVDEIVEATHCGAKIQPVKFARVFLTCIGYMVYRGMDVETAMDLKAAYNEKRPYRHGGKLA